MNSRKLSLGSLITKLVYNLHSSLPLVTVYVKGTRESHAPHTARNIATKSPHHHEHLCANHRLCGAKVHVCMCVWYIWVFHGISTLPAIDKNGPPDGVYRTLSVRALFDILSSTIHPACRLRGHGMRLMAHIFHRPPYCNGFVDKIETFPRSTINFPPALRHRCTSRLPFQCL